MSEKSDKHKKIVHQRVVAITVTLLVVTAIGAGIGLGLSKLADMIPAGNNNVVEATEAAVTEASSEDDWVDVSSDTADYSEASTEVSADTVSDNTAETDPEIEAVISGMSIEQKVAQLFMITPEELTGVATVTAAGDSTEAALKEKPVGGIIYFAKNIADPDQLTKMLTNMQNFSAQTEGMQIFLAVDEEGGSVSRVASNKNFDVEKFDDMASVGEGGNLPDAYNVGNVIGSYLSGYGFNLDFAPVADVLTNPDNKVIGKRSFGSDPQLVADMSWQMASGLQDTGVTACFKHFPGQGGTDGDTHTGTVSSDETLDEMKQDMLIPFQNAVDSGALMIMASHVECPQITGDDTPASLSSVMITDVLRNDMGYNGIVITDSLQMQAVTDKYSPDEAAVMAIQAGDDMLLMPQDYDKAYQGIIDAVKAGTITEERINESLRRILKVKLGKTGN